jgi:hypothetical protein
VPILDSVIPFIAAAPATAAVLAVTRVVVVFLCLRNTDPASRPEILHALAGLFGRRRPLDRPGQRS